MIMFRSGADPEYDSDIEVLADPDSTDRNQDSLNPGEVESHSAGEEVQEPGEDAINARFLNWLSRQIVLLEDYLALGHRLTK